MKINCLITDDEPIAREIIEEYIKLFPELNLVATCSNAIETFSALRSHDVHLLFMDIQMPEISGLNLIRSLKSVPLVIFTTAYPAFAIDGFDLDAVDYLVKPISIERFLKAMDKVFVRLSAGKGDTKNETTLNARQANSFFFVKANSGLHRIEFNHILYIEGLENYIKIVCEDKTIISLSTIKAIESALPPEQFLRIHRSYIVNINKVENVRDDCFNISNKIIPVGKSYSKNIRDILKHRFTI